MSPAVDLSVIIPTFHRSAELRCTILSALEQSGVEIEVLVVDDSPERSAEAVVKSLQDSRLIYIPNPQPSGGFPSRVRNFGPKSVYVACLMFHRAILVCSAGILRRDCLVRLGGFDPELRLREDIDFYARAMRHFGVFFLDQVGLRYWIGSPSLMHSPTLSESDLQQLREAQLRTNTRHKREWGALEFYMLKLFARTVLKVL